MNIHYQDDRTTLYAGNCLDVMKGLDDQSVDAIVTDPPYELGFMGKSWDASGIAFNVEVWREALRVLKPGGHLLAFSGSRTYHRMAVAIEDAGFEIRDQIQWIYGSGFPKSMDVSKAIDKGSGENRARQLKFTAWMRSTGITAEEISRATGTAMASHYLTDKSQPAIATADLFDSMRPYLPEVPEEIERLVAERTGIEWTAYKNREVIGETKKGAQTESTGRYGAWGDGITPTAPSTDAAKTWQGWGTALKPAHEPIVLARKPLIGTVANNVLTHGTGAINIDATRVGDGEDRASGGLSGGATDANLYQHGTHGRVERATGGRWPANVIHDGSEEVTSLFPDTKSGSIKPYTRDKASLNVDFLSGTSAVEKEFNYADSGSAARFFYCAKASKRDRNEGLEEFEAKFAPTMGNGIGAKEHDPETATKKLNHHPTVKPTELMRYLVRMITPPQGVVLDPFLGSGSTGKAAMYEGNRFIGIELTEEYLPIALARIQFAKNQPLEEQLFPADFARPEIQVDDER